MPVCAKSRVTLMGSQRNQDVLFRRINAKALPDRSRLAGENRFHGRNGLMTAWSKDNSFMRINGKNETNRDHAVRRTFS